jgi:hypothetical protein
VNDDPISHFDVFEEYDLRQGHYLRLMDSVFQGQDSVTYYKNRLNENLSKFVRTVRLSVSEDMNRYHSLEGMEFFYVSLPDLVQAMLEDKSFDEDEKVMILDLLTREFRKECLKIPERGAQECQSLSLPQLFERYYRGK